jgi:hypothetical protein
MLERTGLGFLKKIYQTGKAGILRSFCFVYFDKSWLIKINYKRCGQFEPTTTNLI